jgi:hypothetical protein
MATILGQITLNEIVIYEFDGVPSTGIEATVGSFGTDTNTGILYTKTGPADTAWVAVGSSGVRNFSYHKIETDLALELPINQSMITTGLELDGFLELSGGLVFT